ncbi:MAG: alpha-glucosidase/alpha-galactosidase [Oceanipulchritudo sp.]
MKKKSTSRKAARPAGHAAHTQDAMEQSLAGEFTRPIKVTMTGAGSGFTPRIMNDILRTPGTAGGTIALVDIDRGRLRTMARLIRKLADDLGRKNWKVVASEDRRKVLKGTDYLINSIEVSGTKCVEFDNDIPLKYGIDQCIGDTIGPGGLFKALRTIPAWLDILRDCEELCPDALVLNYTNPMAMMCTAAARATSMEVVGLCHSVQGTSHLLARYAGVPYPELRWECAGINHLAWFTTLAHKGKDLYPALKRDFQQQLKRAIREYEDGTLPDEYVGAHRNPEDAEDYRRDLVRKDMCCQFGAFVTESSGHLSEYLPYYRKSEEGRKLLRAGYDGGSRFYASNWPQWRAGADKSRNAMLRGDEPMDWKRSWEFAAWIIEAREKNAAWRFHGNVMNNDGPGGRLITNLPEDACVEVACLVDQNGVQPTRYGALPPQMAALCASNLSMFGLGAQAAIERSKEMAIHALMVDPLTAAVCTPAQVRDMAQELFEAEKDFLPGYR